MNDQHEYLKVAEVLSVRITLDICGHLMPGMQEAARCRAEFHRQILRLEG